MRRLYRSRGLFGRPTMRRPIASRVNSSPMGKLSLAPRFADEDMKLLKSTAPKFKNFLRNSRGKAGGVSGGDGEGKDLVDAEVNAYSPGLESITSLDSAQTLIGSAISSAMPNAALHVLASMDHSLVLPPSISKDFLALIMEKGSTKLMVDLRQMLNRKIPPLTLDEGDIGDCITYCMFKSLPDEAFSWFLVLEDCFNLQPTKSIVSILLPALAKSPSWERLFYVMDEASRLGIPVSARTRYQLVQECEKRSKLRWRYASYFIRDLDLSVVDINSLESDVTAGKCVGQVFQLLAREGQYGEILKLWGQLGQEYRRAAVGEHPHVMRYVGVAAILLADESVVQQLVSLTGGGEGQVLLTPDSLGFSDGDAGGASGVPTVALAWLLFRASPEPLSALHQLRLQACLRSREADTLSLLSHVAAAGIGAGAGAGPPGAVVASAKTLREVADLAKQCLESLLEEEDEGEAEAVPVPVAVAAGKSAFPDDTAAHLISLFSELSDAEGLLLLLESSRLSVVGLSTDAFVAASELLLRCGHREEVLALLETRLNADGSDETASGGPSVEQGSPLRIYGPAVEALAHGGDFEVMVHLLLREIPLPRARRGQPRWPSTQLFLKGVEALDRAGRSVDAVELFKIAITGPAALNYVGEDEEEEEVVKDEDEEDEDEEEEEEEGGVSLVSAARSGVIRPYPTSLDYPVSPALLQAALRSCAHGLLGQDALQILQLVGRAGNGFAVAVRGGVPVEEPLPAAAQQRNMEHVVAALASPTFISALPAAVAYFRSSRRPAAITQRMHLLCLSSALWAGSEEVSRYFVEELRHDEEEHRELTAEERKRLLDRAVATAAQLFSGRGGEGEPARMQTLADSLVK